MESQPQNPEFKNYPEKFHPCIREHNSFHLGKISLGVLNF